MSKNNNHGLMVRVPYNASLVRVSNTSKFHRSIQQRMKRMKVLCFICVALAQNALRNEWYCSHTLELMP
jgi:hypothetical protein